MAENNNVPENTDKMLFAKDLMNHAMMRHAVEIKYKRMTAEIYRNFVRNAFNETIHAAVTILYKKVDMESKIIFSSMFSQRSPNLENYTKYANNISKEYNTNTGDFNARGFLHCCVQLTGLAAAFHKHGYVEAPDLAIKYIVYSIYNGDMTAGEWVKLNEVCANIKETILRKLSPRSTSHEAVSVPSGEQNLDETGAPYPIKIRVGSNCYLKEDFKKYEVKIQKVTLKEYQARFNNNSSTENKEDLKKLKVRYPPSSANSSNFGGNCLMNGSSSGDTFAPGTSNSTGISVLSVKGDNLHLPLHDINLESARNIPPPTIENELSMLKIILKSKRHNSDSEEKQFSK